MMPSPAQQTTAVHLRFFGQARRHPHRLALSDGAAQITYGELAQRALAWASALDRLGLVAGEPVAVCAKPGVGMVVAILAVLEAGGSYLPIDPAYPAARRDFLLADSAVRWVFTEGSMAAELEGSTSVLCLDQPPPPSNPTPSSGHNNPHPEQVAYVIYTSGSTGRPKGVEVPHRGLTALVAWHLEAYAIGPEDRAGQFANPAFDAAVWELWPYLTVGASLHVAPPDIRLAPPALVRWLVAQRLTITFLPTPLAAAAVDEFWPQNVALRALLTGGDRLHQRPRRLPFELVNHYGPTECSVVASAGTVQPRGLGTPDIGHAITGTTLRLLNPWGRPVDPGERGEITIGGAGVARGYLRRPAPTAERFVPDPEGFGSRCYLSGDLARQRSDGRLDFLGRVDHQVKVRGIRVEPGEVEGELLGHQAVRAAAVVSMTRGAEVRLLAAVVLCQEVTAAALRAWLTERLPAGLVPDLLFLDALPLTAHGKVDRTALEARAADAMPNTPSPAQGPHHPLAAEIAAAAAAVLGLPQIGVDEDFFARGGHSLSAARLLARLHRDLSFELTPQEFFADPTAKGLAELFETRRRDSTPPPLPKPRDWHDAPLSPGQQQLWFSEQLHRGVGNVPLACSFLGTLHPPRFAQAFERLVARHPVLLATFREIDGEPRQFPGSAPTPALPVVDLRALPAPSRSARHLLEQQARHPFDLANGPLLRPLLLRTSDSAQVLFLGLHHLVFDGWSLALALDELATFYQDPEAALPPLLLSYADYAAWQCRQNIDPEHLAFWQSYLAGVNNTLQLPTDRPMRRSEKPCDAELPRGAPSQRPARGAAAEHHSSLPTHQAAAAAACGRTVGATLFMTLLAAFQTFLYRLSGTPRLAVGTPVAGRDRPEFEGLIGHFVDILALRGDLEGAPDFQQVLARTRHNTLAAFSHRQPAFASLAKHLKGQHRVGQNTVGQNRLGQHNLFSVLFVFQNTPAPCFDLPNLRLSPAAVTAGRSVEEWNGGSLEFDLMLVVEPTAQGAFNLRLRWPRELFDATTGRRLLHTWQNLLTAAITHPQRPVNELSLLSPSERHQLCYEWADGGGGRDGGGRDGSGRDGSGSDGAETLPQLLTAAARRHGESPALLPVDGAPWSYRQLAARGRKLAAALRHQGVGPESIVALCCPRGPELLLGLWGITAAGAAFLYLDPNLPPKRRQALLDDAQADLQLVSSAPQQALQSPSTVPRFVLQHLTSAGPLPPPPPAKSAAYVIYTSGSSGRPKGVVVSHRALCRRLRALLHDLRLRPGQRVLQLLSPGFDAALQELLAPLVAGGTLVLHPAPDRLTGGELFKLCADQAVNGLLFPAAWWHRVVDDLAPGFTLPQSLEFCVVGGESPAPDRLRRFLQAAHPGTRFFNQYGPTEAVIVATRWQTTAGQEKEPDGALPIGRPLPSTRVEIHDRRGHLVPSGVSGQLCLGGTSLARGYLGHPAGSATHFIPSTCGGAGQRLYLSGDRARFNSAGEIEFLGRLDSQLKVRGHRVEPQEIEQVLGRHPTVAQAAVVLCGSGADQRLVAYYTTSTGDSAEAASHQEHILLEHLRENLPTALVPATCCKLAALPLTANGKIDRTALRARPQEPTARPDIAPYSAPRNELETEVGGLMAEVLSRDRVGMSDDFFDLGGHSLLATRLLSRLRSRFHIDISLGDFFAHPTVAALAQLLHRQMPAATQEPPLDAAGESTPPNPISRRQTKRRNLDLSHLDDDAVTSLLQDLLNRQENSP